MIALTCFVAHAPESGTYSFGGWFEEAVKRLAGPATGASHELSPNSGRKERIPALIVPFVVPYVDMRPGFQLFMTLTWSHY